MKGKISSWDDEKGYGFIEPLGGGRRVFIHIKELVNRSRRPAINQVITYSLTTDKHGRLCAANATRAGDIKAQKSNKRNDIFSIIVALIFLTIVGLAVITYKTPPFIFAFYLIASLITFTVYAMDKAAARIGAWRTPESTLHALALVGGWPGAMIAQQKLRHKSKKQSFRAIFWLTVILNCGAFAWASSPSGSFVLRALLGEMS